MTAKKPDGRSVRDRSRCQRSHFAGRPFSSCAEPAHENVDGLVLCEKHALEAKLEGQIYCWDEMLFHIDLWSREASRRDRPDIVQLLEVQRAESTSAMDRAYEDLARSKMSGGEASSGRGELFRRGSLPLPPKSVRPLSRGLRRR